MNTVRSFNVMPGSGGVHLKLVTVAHNNFVLSLEQCAALAVRLHSVVEQSMGHETSVAVAAISREALK